MHSTVIYIYTKDIKSTVFKNMFPKYAKDCPFRQNPNILVYYPFIIVHICIRYSKIWLISLQPYTLHGHSQVEGHLLG